MAPLGALALGVVGQPALWWRPSDRLAGLHAPDAAGAALALLATLPLALLPRRAVSALAVSSVALVVYDASGYPASPADLASLVALGWVVACSRASVAWAGTGLVAAGIATAALARPGGHRPATLLADSVVMPAAAAVGFLVRMHRERADLARREQALQAERLALQAEQAASAERRRIARELHDAVGHGVTLTALRAEAAARLVEIEPGRSRELLAEVAEAGRSCLEELHLLLAVLREDADPACARTSGTSGIEGVVRRFSGPGMDVRLQILGPPRALGDSLDVTVAAIVAEGLSNIARHARESRGRVRLDFQETSLVVEVSDDGPGPAQESSAGFGLRGTGERVAAVGGQLAFGPDPGGGGLLRAVLPYAVDTAG